MAFKNHKHFRVISPNPILGDWAATATSTPDANSPPRGEEEVRTKEDRICCSRKQRSVAVFVTKGHVDVQKMRAQVRSSFFSLCMRGERAARRF